MTFLPPPPAAPSPPGVPPPVRRPRKAFTAFGAALALFVSSATVAAPAAEPHDVRETRELGDARENVAARDPRDLHAARCVAALDVLTQDLARQARAGDAAARSVLLDRLVAGAAFVGDAYLRGNADEAQAKAARQQALEAQKKLRPSELADRQAACAREGTSLYAAANGFQQYVVRRVAQRRMDKLLGTRHDSAQAAEPPRRER